LSAAVPADEFTRGYRAWMLFILMLMNALNLADRQGLAAVAPVFKRDLHLSDTQLGLIQGLAFAIFYTLCGLAIARLAEHRSRSRIIAVSIAIFSAFGALASQARTFAFLLLCRIGVGVGDAGAVGPPVSSLLGDYYPAGQRGSATTIVWLGAPIGALAGAAIGGWTAQHADWRQWFIGLAIPGFVAAVLAIFTLREPRRGALDAGGPIKGPPTLVIAQNMVDASMRASSAFTVALVFGLVGAGLGPTIGGIMSDLAARHSFAAGNFAAQCPGGTSRPGADSALTSACSISSAYGIRVAMAAVAFLLLWGSLHYFLAARTLRADLDARYQPTARRA
jgi:MFS family permease